jgi:fluoride exporter
VSAYLWIAFGSALGGAARYGVGCLFAAMPGPAFPWATLAINVSGSWLIGFFNTLSGTDGRLLVPVRIRQFVMIGICGGYTTFSAFSLETLALLGQGAAAAAAAYVLASTALCLGAIWLGHLLAARMNRLAL